MVIKYILNLWLYLENIKNLEKEDEPKSSDEQTAVQIYEKTSGKNEETIITSRKFHFIKM